MGDVASEDQISDLARGHIDHDFDEIHGLHSEALRNTEHSAQRFEKSQAIMLSPRAPALSAEARRRPRRGRGRARPR